MKRRQRRQGAKHCDFLDVGDFDCWRRIASAHSTQITSAALANAKVRTR